MSMTNCPNCGAAKDITQTVCPFCGTPMFDLTDIDLSDFGKPCIVRFKFKENIFSMKAYVNCASFEVYPDSCEMVDMQGRWHRYLRSNNVEANITFVSCE